MKTIKYSTANKGFALGSVLVLALAGCTTYVNDQPRPVAYVPPPPAELPPAAVVYTPPPSAEPPVVVIQTESDFQAPLSAYGRWVVVGAYGRCWVPAGVESGWRPYCDGHWQRTDAGWYWVSAEPWGWATYHYGRWDWQASFGWFWVPQTQWAPAWVSWREGAGYVGWAPLPPSARFGVNGMVELREGAIAPHGFVFVEERRLLEPVRPRTVIVNNTIIINRTVNITKIRVVNRAVVNDGPRIETVERVSGRKIQAVPTRELRRKEEETVVRQRNVPAGVGRTGQPPARSEAPPRGTMPPAETRRGERPAETMKPPSAPTGPIGGEIAPKPPSRPTRPEIEKPGPIESRPVLTPEPEPVGRGTVSPRNRPGGGPETKPERAVLPRQTRPAETPVDAQTQPAPPPAKHEVRGAGELKNFRPAVPSAKEKAGRTGSQRDQERPKGRPEAQVPAVASPPPASRTGASPSPVPTERGGKDANKKGDGKRGEGREPTEPQSTNPQASPR